MKSIFASTTIRGAIIALVSLIMSVVGIDIQKAELVGIIDSVQLVWPQLLAIGTTAVAIWGRITATDFDKSIFFSKTFWAAAFTALLSLAGASGINIEGIDTLVEQVIALIAMAGPLIGSVVMIFGRARAKKVIDV